MDSKALVLFTVLLGMIAASGVSDIREPRNPVEVAQSLANRLDSLFEEATSHRRIQQALTNLDISSRFTPDYCNRIRTSFATAKGKIEELFLDRLDALKNIVLRTEELAREADEKRFSSEYCYGDVSVPQMCMDSSSIRLSHAIDDLPADLHFEDDDRIFRRPVLWNRSAIQTPDVIHLRATALQKHVELTQGLDEVFSENRRKYPSMAWQYIGTETGMLRIHPAFWWMSEEDTAEKPPRYCAADKFDARHRPWYGRALLPPKDIIILLDVSGSVYGQPFRLIKKTAKALVESLDDDDFVGVAEFNKNATFVACVPGLLSATFSVKKTLKDAIDQVTPGKDGKYEDGLRFAFDEFDKHDKYCSGAGRSGFGDDRNQNSSERLKVIILLTDGTTEFPRRLLERRDPNATVRVIGYQVGLDINPKGGLMQIACKQHGAVIPVSLTETIPQRVLRYRYALYPSVAWTKEYPWYLSQPYRDCADIGRVATLSMLIHAPVLPIRQKIFRRESGAHSTLVWHRSRDKRRITPWPITYLFEPLLNETLVLLLAVLAPDWSSCETVAINAKPVSCGNFCKIIQETIQALEIPENVNYSSAGWVACCNQMFLINGSSLNASRLATEVTLQAKRMPDAMHFLEDSLSVFPQKSGTPRSLIAYKLLTRQPYSTVVGASISTGKFSEDTVKSRDVTQFIVNDAGYQRNLQSDPEEREAAHLSQIEPAIWQKLIRAKIFGTVEFDAASDDCPVPSSAARPEAFLGEIFKTSRCIIIFVLGILRCATLAILSILWTVGLASEISANMDQATELDGTPKIVFALNQCRTIEISTFAKTGTVAFFGAFQCANCSRAFSLIRIPGTTLFLLTRQSHCKNVSQCHGAPDGLSVSWRGYCNTPLQKTDWRPPSKVFAPRHMPSDYMSTSDCTYAKIRQASGASRLCLKNAVLATVSSALISFFIFASING